MRRVTAAVAFSLLAAGCGGPLGRSVPVCVRPDVFVSTTVIIQLQAVPAARYGICVNELPVGWEYVHQEHRRGEASFWLDSDRMGSRFLTVRLQESCPAASGTEVPSGTDDVRRLVDVAAVPASIGITIVPIGELAAIYAGTLLEEIEGRVLRQRAVTVAVDDDTGQDPYSRIRRALAIDEHAVLVVDDLDAQRDRVGLALPDDDVDDAEFDRMSLDAALERIAGSLHDLSYRGTWYHLFEGGCITWEFDASGPGTETVAADVEAAVGFYDFVDLRRVGRRYGYDFADG